MKHIDQKVEDTLHSLDGIQRAEIDPWFYTRVAQRLANRQQQYASGLHKLMPALALVLVLFISLNAVSYFKAGITTVTPAATGGSDLENFANEYNLSEQTGI